MDPPLGSAPSYLVDDIKRYPRQRDNAPDRELFSLTLPSETVNSSH